MFVCLFVLFFVVPCIVSTLKQESATSLQDPFPPRGADPAQHPDYCFNVELYVCLRRLQHLCNIYIYIYIYTYPPRGTDPARDPEVPASVPRDQLLVGGGGARHALASTCTEE